MKIIKIAFIAAVAISFCSFAYNNSAVKEGREQLFKNFLSEFKSIELPAKTSFKDEVKKIEDRTVLDEKFDAFIPGITSGRMSRMGPSTYEAELLLSANNDKYTTLIYSRSSGFNGRTKSYYLATFDQRGTEIGSQYLGHVHETSYLDLDITANLKIVVIAMQSEDYETAEKNFFPGTIKKMFVTAKGEIMVEEERAFQKEEVVPTKQEAQKLG